MQKDSKLRSIARACAINDNGFAKVLAGFRKGKFKTEKDVARFIDLEIAKAGARNAFHTIVAVGENAVDWHHKPGNTALKRGFCVIDFGARVDRYCGDMTRTIFIGKASAEEKRLYSKVLRANEECIKMVKAGVDGHEIYLHAHKVLGRHAKYFGHGLGHGLSKIIHAKPRLSKKPGQFLRAGDIVTIEPGVYIPGKLGIRIEDDVLVKDRRHAVLSRSTKKLIEIKINN